jgi:hypothetical protein
MRRTSFRTRTGSRLQLVCSFGVHVRIPVEFDRRFRLKVTDVRPWPESPLMIPEQSVMFAGICRQFRHRRRFILLHRARDPPGPQDAFDPAPPTPASLDRHVTFVFTMPARHRERDSGGTRYVHDRATTLSTCRWNPRPRCVGNLVHDEPEYATGLVRQHAAIIVGNVNTAGLAKTPMAKLVLDAGWSTLRTMLSQKCDSAGVWFDEVDERFSTQTCSECGALSGPKGIAGLGIREWCCPCGAVHDRDINSARVILAAGNRRLAEGIPAL